MFRTATHRPPIQPGDMLRHFFDEMNLTQAQLALHLGWTTTKVNQIVQNKRAITPATALALADAFGNTPEFWLNSQQKYDLWQAAQNHKHKPRIAV